MEQDIIQEDFTASANFITKYTHDFLHSLGIPESWINFVNFLLVFVAALLIVFLLQKVVEKVLSFIFKKAEHVSHLSFFKYVQKNKLSHYLALVVPYTFIVSVIPTIFADYPYWIKPCQKIAEIYFVFIIIWLLMSIIRTFTDTLQHKATFKNRPMKSYLQVIQIIMYLFGAVAIYSIMTGKSATAFFAAMGAASAVLMLMFKDTIMGFVASIQISSNKIVMLGDWITMSKYGADGNVEEINLSTVKVRNFDKTITTIPTYSLVSDSFQNWRGMQESGGRRLKRALIIKQADIRFLTDEELDEFQKLPQLEEYIQEKRATHAALNEKLGIDSNSKLKGYRLTNCDLFVKYAIWYLQNNPDININMTLMVRQLAPTPEGLPIELYTFTNTTVWANYETISGEVMNHLLTTVGVFGLTIFESSASSDSLTVNLRNKG